MKKTEALAALGALAHEKRLDVYRLLVTGGMRPGQIGEQLEISQTALSYHLKELRTVGLVTYTRRGHSLTYVAEAPVLKALLCYLAEDYC